MKKAKIGAFTPLGFEFNKKNLTILSVIVAILVITITLSISLPLALKAKGKANEVKYYTLSFDTVGLNEIESRTYAENEIVESLPTLRKDNATFLGWRNKETGESFLAGEKILNDMVLVAKFVENPPLQESVNKVYVSLVDVDKDFSVLLDDTNNGLNAEQVKRGVKLSSITHPDSTDFTVVAEGDKFRLSANKSFAEGGQYTLTILDENIVFSDEEQSVYIMYFSVKKSPVLNLSTKDGIVYLPLSEIDEFTGSLGGLFNLSEDSVSVSDDGGTFRFSGDGIKIGDTVAIFDKIDPSDITLDEDYVNNNVAYLKIVDIEGDTYTYVNPEPEDVLFKPDILPIDAEIVSVSENSLVADYSYFDYTDGRYSEMGLDEETVVEKGDFIAVFEKENVLYYAKITDVQRNGANVIIAFEKCPIEEVQTSMEVYNQKNVDTEKVLDKEYLEENEKVLYDNLYQSGKLASLAAEVCNDKLATERFIRFCRDNDIDMRGLHFYAENNQVKAKSAKKVEVDPSFKIQLTTKLQHFKGEHGEPLSGLRCAIQINLEITFECGDNAEVSLEIQAVLVQEIRIAMNISGYAEWDWWFIFPYIREYHFIASFEFYTYSAVDFNITVATKEPDEEWEDNETKKYYDFAKKLKDYLEKEEYYTEEIDGGVAGLADKYAEMLEIEADYVPIVEKTLFEIQGGIDPFHILCYKFEIKFVVGVSAQASLGVSFEYENAKRFIYSVELFSRKVKSDTIDLVEEAYSLEAYAMGKIGIKVGFEASIELGLFSTDLDSIGLTAGVGAYADLYGYIYYSLNYSASEGRSTDFYGAMYFELGIYFDLSFTAQAFKGTFEYEKELLSYKWPLYNAGNIQNVLDFSLNNDEEEITIELYNEDTSIKLDTDRIFSLYYLDLAEGETGDDVYKPDQFDISLTNRKYHFDPITGTLMLLDTSGLIEDCKIIFTYTGAWLSFSKYPVQLIVDIHWDRLDKEGYSISFDSVGGSYVSTIFAEFDARLTRPKNPVKAGYDFQGWFTDKECTTAFVFPETMGAENITVYAGWQIKTNVSYAVEHYVESLESGKFELYQKDSLSGTAFETLDANVLEIDGFLSPSKQSVSVGADGKSTVKYYYLRKSYNILVNPQNGEGEKTYTLKYGASVILPKLIKVGYDFLGYDKDLPDTMPASNLTFNAIWTESEDTLYLVEHYLEKLSGEFELVNGNVYHGKTDDNTCAEVRTYSGFTANPFENTRISADGKTVVRIYYSRNIHKLTWILNGACEDFYTEGDMKFGSSIIAPVPHKTGFVFAGFDVELPSVMPDNDLTITALWNPLEVNYKVEYYLQDLGEDSYFLKTSENKKGFSDALTEVEAKQFEGFTVNDFEQIKISPLGDSVLKIYYSRNTYTLTWNLNGGTSESQTELVLEYQAKINEITAVKVGYTFVGYADALPETMPYCDLTVTLVWIANSNTQYTVHHLFKDLGADTYSLKNSEKLFGTTDALTKAEAKNVLGFTANSFEQVLVSGDGSAVVEIYYSRNTYVLSWNFQTFNAENEYTQGEIEYESQIDVPIIKRAGYALSWDREIPEAMPYCDLTITAVWTALNVDYTVEHKIESLQDGEFELYDSQTLSGKTDTLTKAEALSIEGFTAIEHLEKVISGEGDTVVEIRYSRNVYTLSWNGNGVELSGEYTSGKVKFGTEIKSPVLVKAGYELSWDKTVPETMPAKDLTVTAVWTALNVDYTVEHKIESLQDGEFALYNSQTLSGKTDTLTKAEALSIEGFTANEHNEKVISGNGDTVVEILYTRNSYNLSWDGNGVELSGEYTSGIVKFGQSIVIPVIAREGYVLAWDKDVPETMPAYDVAFKASWLTKPVDFTIKHFLKEVGKESYVLDSEVTQKGETDSMTNAVAKNIVGFVAKEFSQEIINGNGSTVIEIYYDRLSYSLSWSTDGMKPENAYTSGIVEFGAQIIPPILEKAGYELSWDKAIPETMPAYDISISVVWIAKEVEYTVKHYFKEIGSQTYNIDSVEVQKGKTALLTNAEARIVEGFTSKDFSQENIEGDGSTVVEIYYDRNFYSLTWNANGANPENNYTSGNVEFGTQIIPPILERAGYELTWDRTIPETMPASELVINAIWTATNVPYVVNHKIERLDGAGYDLYQTKTLSGITDELTVAESITIEGFVADNFAQVVISGDGSTVVDILYSRKQYTVVFVIDEEESVLTLKYGDEIISPTPVKAGYTASWDKEIPQTVTSEMRFTCVWTANTDTPYSVKYMKTELSGETTLIGIRTLYGTTGTDTKATAENYVGFSPKPFSQKTIAGDGSTQIEIIYVRNKYTVYIDLNGGEGKDAFTFVYGQKLIFYEDYPPFSKVGYDFDDFAEEYPQTMPAENLTLTCVWAPRFDTNYFIMHYLENLDDDGYTLEYSDQYYGTTGELTNAKALDYQGFTVNEITQKEISGDGNTVVNIYYTRHTHTLSFLVGDGKDVVSTLKYQAPITIPTFEKEGYMLSWDSFIPELMPDYDLSFEAVWTANNNTPYTVEHYIEELSGAYTLENSEQLFGTTDQLSQAVAKSFDGYTPTAIEQKTIFANGSTVITIRYERNKYTLSWETSGGTLTGEFTSGEVKFGTPIIAPSGGIKEGYKFNGINNLVEVMPKNNLTLRVNWTPITYTVRFDRNGGSGTLRELSATFDQNLTLPSEGFSKTGYTFAGYSLTSNGNGVYAVGQEVKNLVSTDNGTITLYAYYSPIKYRVTFNPNHLNGASGSGSSTQTATYDQVITPPVVTSSSSISTIVFKGWSKTPNGDILKQLINLATEKGESVMLYAIWGPSSENTTDFAGGNGTSLFPYKISSADHFQNIVNYPSAHYMLISNIALNNQMVSGTFTGVLDGQNFTISGAISISSSGTNSQNIWVGPISYNKGTIKNVVSTVNVTLSNTSNTANITYAVGGIAGNNEGEIANCIAHDATINVYHQRYVDDRVSTFTVAGGVVGQSSGRVTACASYNNTLYSENDSTKKSWGYYYAYAGGLIGQINGGTVANCASYNNSVEAKAGSGGDPGWFEKTYIHAFVGGFVGKGKSGTISNCYAGNNNRYASITNHSSTSYTDNHASGSALFVGDNSSATIEKIYGDTGYGLNVAATGGEVKYSATLVGIETVAQKLNENMGSSTFSVVNGNLVVKKI